MILIHFSLFVLLADIDIFPRDFHLSWTGTPNEMYLTWMTRKIDDYEVYINDVQATYKDYQISIIENQIFYIHSAIMAPLKEKNSYSVSHRYGITVLQEFNGITPDDEIQENYADDPVKFIIFGDWGTGSIAEPVSNMITKHASQVGFMDTVLHVGDIGYNLHELGIADLFKNQIEPVARRYPYMTVPGNHEYKFDASNYTAWFNMPGKYYSFNMGPAHYIMLDTTVIVKKKYKKERKEELKWLEKDLKKASELGGWLIVLGHHPLYWSANWREPILKRKKGGNRYNQDCEIDNHKMRKHTEDLFVKYGVDVYFCGHTHRYERMGPVVYNLTASAEFADKNSILKPGAPVYIQSGKAGWGRDYDGVSPTPAEWSRFQSNDLGYGRLIVYNSSHLYWEQYSAETEKVIDYVWIIK